MNKQNCKTKAQNCIKSEVGQMSIFIALIFQILFVFFAMVINIGLVVHDKINLQNSVDIAAVYGAQKQAESLNSISHINFQIRQAWKLLSWRIRVIGGLGFANHPARAVRINGNVMGQGLEEWGDLITPDATANKTLSKYPLVCVTHDLMKIGNTQFGQTNVCQPRNSNFSVTFPRIVDYNVPGFPGPWNTVIGQITKDLQQQYTDLCRNYGAINWMISSRWLSSYKMEAELRSQMINGVADLLKKDTDIRGQSIADGVKRTLNANLTRANKASIQSEIETFNSIQSMEQKSWLRRIEIVPAIIYFDLHSGIGVGCTGQPKNINMLPEMTSQFTPAELQKFGLNPGSVIRTLSGADSPGQMVTNIGFEKNPWAMVYYGVKATTAPSKPFLPFGVPAQLTAKAFAKPFGGKLGPWFKDKWDKGSNASSGQKVDPHLPDQIDPESGSSISIIEGEGWKQIPNYSKFPKDIIGLRERRSLGIFGEKWRVTNSVIMLDGYNNLLDQIKNNKQSIYNPGNFGGASSPLKYISEFEISTLTPDLFDMYYYSIEPHFYARYGQYLKTSLPADVYLDEPATYQDPKDNSVENTLEIAKAYNFTSYAYYTLQDINHLLNNWTSDAFSSYDFPVAFGTCYTKRNVDDTPTSGNCIHGGRSGFSVKLVSKSYLEKSDHALGGPSGAGSIINVPPESF